MNTNIILTLASLTDDSIAEADHIGVVPFDDGHCAIKNKHTSTNIIEHYLGGQTSKTQVKFEYELALDLQQTLNNETPEWVEIIFEKE